MQDPSLALQATIYAALSGAAGLSAAFAGSPRIYDRVPLDPAGRITAEFPYVQIGDDHMISDADQCHDATSAYASVHVWSRGVGKVEAKRIMAAVCLVLDANLTVAGFQIITHQVADGPRHLTDADGLTSHSVATFHYRLGPTA
jgi:hypothetical protein